MKEEEKLAEVHKVKFLEVYKLTTPGLLTESEIDNYNRGLGIGYEHGFLAGLKAGKDMNVSTKWHDLRKDPKEEIEKLKELVSDCLFYCDHIDPYYNECLTEDNIFERAEKLGVKYE